jgi:hypothetical protein
MTEKNVFEGVGGQMTGEGYIGRHNELDKVRRIFKTKNKDGSYVISGLTRMGKTSLVKKCFEEAETSGLLEENRIVTVSITMSKLTNFRKFLFGLGKKIHSGLEKGGYISDSIEELYDELMDYDGENDDIGDIDEAMGEMLRQIKKERIKLVILIDEFDDAKRVFDGNSQYFQILRDYISDADYSTTFLLTCRKSISEVDASLYAGSNLRGVLGEIVLVGFTDVEREEFFDKIAECGVSLNEEQKKKIIEYAGRSPLLLSKLAYEVLETGRSVPADEIDISAVFRTCKKDFGDYFDSIIKFMRSENQFSKFVQIFFGPVYDITQKDIDKLIDYGYIYHKEDENFTDAGYIGDSLEDADKEVFTYQTLSRYFVEYVRKEKKGKTDGELWADLTSAERKLRNIVEEGLNEQYGAKWREELDKCARTGMAEKHGYLYDVNKAEAFIQNSKKEFGDAVDDNPLTVINIRSLGNIICMFWDDLYFEVLNPPYDNKESLSEELEKINRVRNPLAHGTAEYLSADDREQVGKCCKKIINIDINKKSGKHK